jgi:hypothetical protein
MTATESGGQRERRRRSPHTVSPPPALFFSPHLHCHSKGQGPWPLGRNDKYPSLKFPRNPFVSVFGAFLALYASCGISAVITMKQKYTYVLATLALGILQAQDANGPQLDGYGSPLESAPWVNDALIAEKCAIYDAVLAEGIAASTVSPRSWITRASIVDPANSAWAAIRRAGLNGAYVLVRATLLALTKSPGRHRVWIRSVSSLSPHPPSLLCTFSPFNVYARSLRASTSIHSESSHLCFWRSCRHL